MTARQFIEQGSALRREGKLSEAAEMLARGLALDPLSHAACRELGHALRDLGKLNEAVDVYERGLSMQPADIGLLNGLGNALRMMRLYEKAIAVYRQALELDAGQFKTHHNLAMAYQEMGDKPRAIPEFERALELNEQLPSTHQMLVRALSATGQIERAILAGERAARLWPEWAEIWQELGVVLCLARRDDEAIAAFERALALNPNHYLALNNMGHALLSRGEFERAIEYYDQALEIAPQSSNVASNRMFLIQCTRELTPAQMRAELDKWDRRHALHLRDSIPPHANDRSPDRPLRIGYVSPDFRKHVVGWNLLPILSRHDRKQFKVFAYSNTERRDEMTEKLRGLADGWREITAAGDDQAADIIRADRIDILVDLSLHSAGNRLLIFARKPAPVQVTYLGYTASTGLPTIDYRLSDLYLDPPDADLSGYVEQTIRLPRSYWCYRSGGPTPEVNAAPFHSAGHVTFGCLANFFKVSTGALELWGRILSEIPRSRLLIYCSSEPRRAEVRQRMAKLGVEAGRLEFVGWQDWDAYIRTYHRIDVGLDPFPRGGGITSCDALWMGVPVITLAGKNAMSRGGCSVLGNVGLPELVAQSAEDYVHLAKQAERWIELRPALREKMRSSPLMDAEGFARDLEAAYRWMWKKWLETAV
jgi:protein O-GlcNAc transferase